MIKINLAKRRRPAAQATSIKGSFDLLASFSSLRKIDFDTLKNIDWKTNPLPRFLLAAVVVYLAQFEFDDYRQMNLNELEKQIGVVQKEQDEVLKKLAKVKGFEPLKKQLEADEKMVQQKVDVLNLLLEDRDIPTRLMKQLSQIIPEDVWLTGFGLKEGKLNLTGGASSYNLVSDFMKSLNDSSLFTDVGINQLSENLKDGTKFQQFDISAKRRVMR